MAHKNIFQKFLGFLKKLPNFIGKIVIVYFIVNLLDLLDSYYIKICTIFLLIGAIIISLDYLLKYLITLYFIKDKEVIIPTKLPKIIYDYLNDLKIISKINESIYKFFLINFVTFVIFIFIIIIILIVI